MLKYYLNTMDLVSTISILIIVIGYEASFSECDVNLKTNNSKSQSDLRKVRQIIPIDSLQYEFIPSIVTVENNYRTSDYDRTKKVLSTSRNEYNLKLLKGNNYTNTITGNFNSTGNNNYYAASNRSPEKINFPLPTDNDRQILFHIAQNQGFQRDNSNEKKLSQRNLYLETKTINDLSNKRNVGVIQPMEFSPFNHFDTKYEKISQIPESEKNAREVYDQLNSLKTLSYYNNLLSHFKYVNTDNKDDIIMAFKPSINNAQNKKIHSNLVPKNQYQASKLPQQVFNINEPSNVNINSYNYPLKNENIYSNINYYGYSNSNFYQSNKPNSEQKLKTTDSSITKNPHSVEENYGSSNPNCNYYGLPGPNAFSNFAPGNVPNNQNENPNTAQQNDTSSGNDNYYGLPGPNAFSNFAPGNVPNNQNENPNTAQQNDTSAGDGEPVLNNYNNNILQNGIINYSVSDSNCSVNDNSYSSTTQVYFNNFERPSFKYSNGELNPNSFFNFSMDNKYKSNRPSQKFDLIINNDGYFLPR
ncbi:probable serine/threonine-protein kinase clkA isoform X3 [Daktulosphaira vitifoliae]|uniref:probable serine/threonine-protein kinase clkA isoform X2 n=1 Tax=Daktulosphaira vitifoliae TaxID=58002 RepID=UPI0021AA3634|nr:probable serine/threonine-protein kinase clkA isoform X2 [Daktulosphaira vitifoliae]XP_050542120.1 probable serine/threonine-protein kinase clkA isoform X3 [Daktulosphaira vitifoliae]